MTDYKGTRWGADHFAVSSPVLTSLESSVKMLNAKTKQAFYAAIIKNGTIYRATWNGCAFNAGGKSLGEGISIASVEAAAEVFETSEKIVLRFISAWDNSDYETDEVATKALMEMLETVGIFNDPDESKSSRRRIVVEVAMASTMSDKELHAEFAQIVKDEKFNDELAELLASAESVLV